ncbi:hypothetical protein [Polluticoccus soli]|uniref:hypothetical protein n=1 Tax=Polluticoccus soli TaxID=3034150 RepID=UPI0023E15E17|nr:hypothetical protein [Flavipsychrobacter sp. JY13-12]
MKPIALLLFVLLATACTQNNSSPQQAQTTAVQQKEVEAYHPGIGEFMASIQMHHAKLWFAGDAGNWPLAEFEAGEIKELFEDVGKYNTDRPEISKLPLIEPALDSIDNAIRAKNVQLFKSSFTLLTNTCNDCHRATKFEFNVIKIPDAPPVTNQVFTPQ